MNNSCLHILLICSVSIRLCICVFSWFVKICNLLRNLQTEMFLITSLVSCLWVCLCHVHWGCYGHFVTSVMHPTCILCSREQLTSSFNQQLLSCCFIRPNRGWELWLNSLPSKLMYVWRQDKIITLFISISNKFITSIYIRLTSSQIWNINIKL